MPVEEASFVMRTILFLLLLILSSCLGVSVPWFVTGGEAEVSGPGPTRQYDIVIEDARLVTTASGPALVLSGYIPDGCNFPVSTGISHDGNTIRVDVFRTGPVDAVCPQVITPYSDTIPMPELPPGMYTIHVHDTTFEAALPGAGARPTPAPPQFEPTPAPPLSRDAQRSYPIITDVQVKVLESYPAQVMLHVTGQFRDGCELPVTVEQQRSGDVVSITIWRTQPVNVVCPMVLQPFEHTIKLDSSFEFGTYTVIVNDFSTTFTV